MGLRFLATNGDNTSSTRQPVNRGIPLAARRACIERENKLALNVPANKRFMLNIRMATVDDAATISAIVVECSKTHIGPTLSPEGLSHLLAEMTLEKQRQRMANGFVFWLAERDADAVATVAIRAPAHLYYLFVRTEHQGQGFGRKLFDVAREHIAATASAKVITVNSSLNAVDVYKRLGFVASGPVETQHDVHFQPMQWTVES